LTYVNSQVTFALSPLIRGIPLARKILLADDSVTAQNMGRKILADAGYEVIAVNNGSAALKKIAELKPDLVILDVYMPGYSGLEVCQRLKESPETARIPVLLTVGKLEPFKPEEAQRVRAEGFIVKPFEASELLGTLSKLEDKVVPRAEPSKPGRFARAIAAAEESGRGGREETTDADNGWKSRIGFPKKKVEAEEKAADEASINKPAEKAASKNNNGNKEDTRPGTEKAAEASVDLAALAPAGLPKDVTPEEVAAIAAAAAQMQMVASALKQERATGDADIENTAIPSQPGVHVAPDRTESNFASASEVSRDAAPAVGMETKTQAPAESKKEESKPDSISSDPTAVETYRRRKGDVSPDLHVEVGKDVRGEVPKEVAKEEAQDVPVIMAATAESVVSASAGGSRWTAVSVALEGSESAISLDQEMQKAYAAVAGAGSTGIAAVSGAEPAKSSAPAPAAVETPTAISNPEPEPVSASEPARIPAPVETGSTPGAEAAALASPFEVAAPAPIAAVNAPVEAPAEASTTAASSESKPEPGTQVAQPRPEAATADAVRVPRAEEVAERPAAEPVPEPKLDSETVKNTAAAWATWRQVHDSSQNNQIPVAQPKETDQPESASPDTAARAVAAGAEQLLQEAASIAPDGDQSNVASIVDSVLADLRPKLMEEINRKMSKKK
jgi:CheY-like chemotaxis protein